jgi:hypothetical protein
MFSLEGQSKTTKTLKIVGVPAENYTYYLLNTSQKCYRLNSVVLTTLSNRKFRRTTASAYEMFLCVWTYYNLKRVLYTRATVEETHALLCGPNCEEDRPNCEEDRPNPPIE